MAKVDQLVYSFLCCCLLHANFHISTKQNYANTRAKMTNAGIIHTIKSVQALQ